MLSTSNILIIDYGSQYTQVIARKIREFGVSAYIEHFDITKETIVNHQPSGIILAGGPDSSYSANAPQLPLGIFDMEVPILGICYGMQIMTIALGGKVERGIQHEFGLVKSQVICDNSLLLANIQPKKSNVLDVWMSHTDQVTDLPQEFNIILSTDNTPVTAIENIEKQIYGVQFHPEVSHCEGGDAILHNFVYKICQCTLSWKPQLTVDKRINEIKNTVGNDEVILATSGGVDSTVVACLLHQAIGNNLKCIFIDNGLLRQNEVTKVKEMFVRLGIKLNVLDASDLFLTKLSGVTDPETKRKIIGNTFIECFEAESKKFSTANWLAQGTIYPDVIESAAVGKNTAVIKTHHNVGGLPQDMNLKLIEPIKDLFKDEVRKLAHSLDIPADLFNRHPFPGPGLAVRIMGDIKPEYLHILRQADAIYLEELKKSGWYQNSSQAFCVFLPIKSVGVTGDGRSYGYVIAIRAVQTQDFMTANYAPIPHDILGKISSRIINEVKEVARVVLDISSKPPATIEWE